MGLFKPGWQISSPSLVEVEEVCLSVADSFLGPTCGIHQEMLVAGLVR